MNNFQYVDKLRLTTPKATLKYPKLIEPETKFSPEGHYKVTAVIPAEDAAELADQLDALYEAHKASLKAQAPGQKFKAVDPSFGYEDIDGKPVATQQGPFLTGTNRLSFRDLIEVRGIHNYTVELHVVNDPLRENNVGAGLVRVDVGPRILVLNSDGAKGNIVRALESARLPVDVAVAGALPLVHASAQGGRR